jgi:hypothetical protein
MNQRDGPIPYGVRVVAGAAAGGKVQPSLMRVVMKRIGNGWVHAAHSVGGICA